MTTSLTLHEINALGALMDETQKLNAVIEKYSSVHKSVKDRVEAMSARAQAVTGSYYRRSAIELLEHMGVKVDADEADMNDVELLTLIHTTLLARDGVFAAPAITEESPQVEEPHTSPGEGEPSESEEEETPEPVEAEETESKDTEEEAEPTLDLGLAIFAEGVSDALGETETPKEPVEKGGEKSAFGEPLPEVDTSTPPQFIANPNLAPKVNTPSEKKVSVKSEPLSTPVSVEKTADAPSKTHPASSVGKSLPLIPGL